MFWSSLFITFFFEESDFQYLYNKQTYSWFFIWWNHDIRILCWFKEYSFPTTFLCIYATKLKWNLLALEMDRFTTKKFTLLKKFLRETFHMSNVTIYKLTFQWEWSKPLFHHFYLSIKSRCSMWSQQSLQDFPFFQNKKHIHPWAKRQKHGHQKVSR